MCPDTTYVDEIKLGSIACTVRCLLRKKAVFIATARMLNRACDCDGRASWFSLSHLSLDIDMDVDQPMIVERLPSCLEKH